MADALKARGGGQPFGVILAGGQARRMGGGDKALLALAGETLLARVIARMGLAGVDGAVAGVAEDLGQGAGLDRAGDPGPHRLQAVEVPARGPEGLAPALGRLVLAKGPAGDAMASGILAGHQADAAQGFAGLILEIKQARHH